MLVYTFNDRHTKLDSWIAESEKYLNERIPVSTITDARASLSRLDGFVKDKNRQHDFQVLQLKQLSEEILGLKYATNYSTYSYEKPNEVKDRQAKVEDKWVSLIGTLESKKRSDLEKDLAREIEKERLAMEFARLAAEFDLWTSDQIQSVNGSHTQFGFTLEEVEAYQSKLQASNQSINQSLDTKQKEYTDVFDKLTNLGVKDNKFTKLTPDQLKNKKTALLASVATREDLFKKELQRQRENDKLCKQFADLVEPFVSNVSKGKDTINQSKGELEDQLKFVQSNIQSVPTEQQKLKPINELYAQIEERNITNNRYTTYTSKDVEVQFEQYKSFLNKKAKMLEEEIEHNKLRGITQEQFNEIESVFKQFDKNNSSSIDKKELKAVLYSLGEEKSRTEVDDIMKKYAGGTNAMSYNNFREFMIDIMGVSDTKDDILHSFTMINKGDENANLTKMDLFINDEDKKYFVSTSKKNADGTYDYKQWTDVIFSR